MGLRSAFSVGFAAAALMICAVLAPMASAAPVNVDTTYATNGFVERGPSNSQLAGEFQSSALQADSMNVVVGSARIFPADRLGFYVARYTTSGAPDPGFPTIPAFGPRPAVEGTLVDFGGNTESFGTDVTILPDGKILVYGTSYDPATNVESPAFARLNPDGSLDTTFDGDGLLVVTGISLSFNDAPQHGLAVDGDGRMAFVGTQAGNIVVGVRKADGTPDTTFGPGGFRTLSPGTFPLANDVRILPSGKVVVIGTADEGAFVAQFNADGTLDTGFGSSSGYTRFSGTTNGQALVVDGSGKLVAVGDAGFSSGAAFVARLNADGSLDTGFGTGGIRNVPGVYNDPSLNGVALQPDGKIVTAGDDGSLGSGDSQAGAAVARFNTDGSFDTSFDGSGYKIVQPPSPPGDALADDLVIEPSGRIIVAGGFVSDSGFGQLIFALVSSSPPPDPVVDPDLSIQKKVSDKKPKLGEQFTYTVTVRNTGSGPASDVVMTDPVPKTLKVGKVTPSQGECDLTGRRVKCELGGIPAGAGAQVKIRATATEPGRFKNTASIPSDKASATIRVPGKAKLAIDKKVLGDSTVRVGDPVRFQIEVTSTGNIAAKNVVTCDEIPSGLQFVTSPSKYFVEDGQVCWKGGALEPGESKRYLVLTEALRKSGRIVNPATADGANTKPVEDTASTRVKPVKSSGQDGVTG